MEAREVVQEPARQVPVVRTVDVVVAGAGISGLFAALAAGRCGARTVLVERFGSLGGNIGAAGMWMAFPGDVHLPHPAPGRPVGVIEELAQRVEDVLGDMPRTSSTVSLAISRVALDMMAENGVELMLSAWAAAPIMDGDRVCGLFVETKSGRVAVRARVVIDCTGDADIAARAGVPTRWPIRVRECTDPYFWEFVKLEEYEGWNDGGFSFFVAEVDWPRFQEFLQTPVELTPADLAWRNSTFLRHEGHMWEEGGKVHYRGKVAAVMYPLLRQAWESGEYRTVDNVRDLVHVYPCHWWHRDEGGGLVTSRVQVSGYFNMSDWKDVSLVEAAVRKCAFDMVRFYRRHVAGWEKAWMVAEPAFLGTRGGTCIEAEHTLTAEEACRGYRALDVLFAVGPGNRGGGRTREGHDIPYGMILPKKVDGLLVAGRGAGYLRRGHDPDVRARGNMMRLGQAAGLIAALAARADRSPRAVDIREIQRRLLAEGFFLGDEARLRELGLVPV